MDHPIEELKKTARARKAEEARHAKIVSVRMTSREFELMRMRALRQNMKLTSFIRVSSVDAALRACEEEGLFLDVKPEDRSAAQAAVGRMIDEFKRDMGKTWSLIDERLLYQEVFMEKFAWLVCNMFEIPNHALGAKEYLADKRMKWIREKVKDVLVKGQGGNKNAQ